MKRLFLLIMLVWQKQLKLYLTAAFIGSIVGIFILAPSYEYISTHEQNSPSLSSLEYIARQIIELLTGNISENNLTLLIFYAEIGAMIGLFSLMLYKIVHNRLTQINYLQRELEKDLPSIIRQGEGPYLEFKSSLRWDIKEERTNRTLETVILKTLAGFLNSYIGGTLLIGVADNGELLGLEKDFQTLKKQNEDGFEQAIMTAIAANLGADLCHFVHILFHVLDSKVICRLIISPAPRPVFLEQGNSVKFFVRTGGATRDLNIQEALSYATERWTQSKLTMQNS